MTENDALAAVAGMVMDTKIGDWKPQIDERQIRMDAAEKLRDAAEKILGYCHIDPTRSAIKRKRIPKLEADKNRRAAMTPQERARIDLTWAMADAKLDVMKKHDLTFGEMNEVREAVPV